MSLSLDDMNGNPVFDAQPSPTAVLDTDFVIRAVNRPYLAVSGRTADELVGANILEAFPDNPQDPEADGAANLRRSLEIVVRSRRMHNMLIQRYDIPDPDTGRWAARYWTPLNAPIYEEGNVIGVVHRVEDITPLHRTLDECLARYGDLLETGQLTEERASQFLGSAAAFATSAREYGQLVDEVTHLRRALTSRATIEQAKGILIAEQRCTPDAAFQLLRRMSNNTNVPVAAVAAALVYRAHGPQGEAAAV